MNETALCPFCVPDLQIVIASPLTLVIRDSFAVSTNHSLVIPRRHVASIFELETVERAEIWKLVEQVQSELKELGADAVNIGVNDGIAAGQTVNHAHVHVIPRYDGDVEDPRVAFVG